MSQTEKRRFNNLCQITKLDIAEDQSREGRMSRLLARKIGPHLRSLIADANREGDIAESISGKFCSGCSFCCWSKGVAHVPLVSISGNPLGPVSIKPAGSNCAFDVNKRCKLHGHGKMPVVCQGYACAYTSTEAGMPTFYLTGDTISLFPFRIHQPELFRDVLEKLNFNSVIPAIPIFFPVEEAKRLIQETDCCLGQDKYFISLMVRHGKIARYEDVTRWGEVVRPKDSMAALSSANKFILRVMKQEIAQPGFIEAVEGLIKKGVSPEEAFRTGALGDVFNFGRYDVLLNESEQRWLQEETKEAA